jgi:hypothetical protein
MTVQPESTAGALDIQAVLWESNVQAVLDDLAKGKIRHDEALKLLRSGE